MEASESDELEDESQDRRCEGRVNLQILPVKSSISDRFYITKRIGLFTDSQESIEDLVAHMLVTGLQPVYFAWLFCFEVELLGGTLHNECAEEHSEKQKS